MEATLTPGGWRRAGERLLTVPEIGEITLIQRRSRRYTILAGFCVPLSFIFWIAAMATAFAMSRDLPGPWIFLPSLLMALCFLWMRDNVRREAGLRKDLKRGTVVYYEGRLGWPECDTMLESRLFEEGLLRRDSVNAQVLEILPEARVVWRVDGLPPAKLRFETEPISLTMIEDTAVGECMAATTGMHLRR